MCDLVSTNQAYILTLILSMVITWIVSLPSPISRQSSQWRPRAQWEVRGKGGDLPCTAWKRGRFQGYHSYRVLCPSSRQHWKVWAGVITAQEGKVSDVSAGRGRGGLPHGSIHTGISLLHHCISLAFFS